MNISIIYSSLRYVNDNYKLLVYFIGYTDELVQVNYSDDKLKRSLKKWDYEIAEIIITFIKDKSILTSFLTDDLFEYVGDVLYLIKLLLNNAAAEVHTVINSSLIWASYYGYDNVVELLLKNGADVHSLYDQALRNAS